MKHLLKKLARKLFGDYAIYHIYANPVLAAKIPHSRFSCIAIDKAQIESSKESLICEQAAYHTDDAFGYACLDESGIVGLCYFWHGADYLKRNFWPLQDGEAKLVQIVTLPRMRGQGAAGSLIAYATSDMLQRKFQRLYARIWHSNTASLHAFERAGWECVATRIELYPLSGTRPLRITFPALRSIRLNKSKK